MIKLIKSLVNKSKSKQSNNNSNAMLSLNLYKSKDTWMFDDERFNIIAEPFVMGMSEIISRFLPKGKNECLATFSLNNFPGAEELTLDREEANGGWYTVTKSSIDQNLGLSGWLCPVTRIYLNGIPKNIYYNVK